MTSRSLSANTRFKGTASSSRGAESESGNIYCSPFVAIDKGGNTTGMVNSSSSDSRTSPSVLDGSVSAPRPIEKSFMGFLSSDSAADRSPVRHPQSNRKLTISPSGSGFGPAGRSSSHRRGKSNSRSPSRQLFKKFTPHYRLDNDADGGDYGDAGDGSVLGAGSSQMGGDADSSSSYPRSSLQQGGPDSTESGPPRREDVQVVPMSDDPGAGRRTIAQDGTVPYLHERPDASE